MRAMSEPTTAFVVMTILLIGCRHPEPIQKPREADLRAASVAVQGAHLRVSDRDRSPLLNLIQKPGHHAAVASYDISESNRNERCVISHCVRSRAYDQLRNSLSRSHHAGRIDRLV